MRLTAELISLAQQFINPVRERQLSLRGMSFSHVYFPIACGPAMP